MSRILTVIGLLVSTLYTFAIFLLVQDRLPSLKTLELNLLGDFLAGVFGPVALLWLILGYLQQGIELKLNTKALELQVTELKASVEQQRELVEVSKQQFEAELEVLRYERTQVELAMQPRFVPDQVGSQHHTTSGRSTFHLSIKNLGASITNVSFTFSASMQKVEPPLLAEWPEGEAKRVLFYFPDFGVADTDLMIAYATKQGISGTKIFRLVADRSEAIPKLNLVRPDL